MQPGLTEHSQFFLVGHRPIEFEKQFWGPTEHCQLLATFILKILTFSPLFRYL